MTLLNEKRPLMLYFYTDPGHGWLAVKRELLLNLGSIALAISPYSYQRNEVVYLEEDCDAGHFISAMKIAGINIGLIYQHSELSSEIRQFERFALTASEKAQLKPSFTACLRQVVLMFEETGLSPGAGL